MILILLLLSDLWLDRVNFKKEKHFKKISEELIITAWNPKKWGDFCMPDVDKKERFTFYWAMLLLKKTWKYWNILI